MGRQNHEGILVAAQCKGMKRLAEDRDIWRGTAEEGRA